MTTDPIGDRRGTLRAERISAGRGRFVADLRRPRMLHAAFLRSPHAHAEILSVDVVRAAARPGVVAVLTGREVARLAAPMRGAHDLFPDLKAPFQHPVAVDRVRFVGEPVALVLAASRALAEDALDDIDVGYTPLPAVVDPAEGAAGGVLIHPDLGTNVCLHAASGSGDVAAVMAAAPQVVGTRLVFSRHTGVPLETRGLLAEFEPTIRSLDVTMSHQCPHQMQEVFAEHLGLERVRVRIVTLDVGGAFGIKQQAYGDEIAVAAAAILLGRPIMWIADRIESMAADIHAREHTVAARMAVGNDGEILAIEVDDLFGIGPYSQYPRTSVGEGRALLTLAGAPYAFKHLAASTRVVYQNKGMVGHYRGVGHPIACAVTERLVDLAAARLGMDPVAIRRRNFVPPSALPYRAPTGVVHDRIDLGRCLDALEAAVDLDGIRRTRDGIRSDGRLAGMGVAAFVELTTRGPAFYGDGGVRVSTRDSATVSLEPGGFVQVVSSVTEQGQGAETGVAQIVSAVLGVPIEQVRIVTGDTGVSGHGGGTWASRSVAAGGEAAFRAAGELRSELLELAAGLLQAAPDVLALDNGAVIVDGRTGIGLAELADLAHFRPHRLGADCEPVLVHSASFGPDRPFREGCGVQLSLVEIDPDTGVVSLLQHVVAHDCGRMVNPLLVEEQIRGGVVQGIGAALYEELLYDEEGQLLNASLADYLVPMAGEMPDIVIVHVDGSPSWNGGGLGLAGVGEAGTAGASGAVLNAINDALRPRGASLDTIPATPDRVLSSLGTITPARSEATPHAEPRVERPGPPAWS